MTKFETFRNLHTPGKPLVLYNVWDAGSAQAVTTAGALALATGSWSVAAAQGFNDGEALPLGDALLNASRIAAATVLPVSVDFEGGYAEDPAQVAENVSRLLETGAIGLNFEDQTVGAPGFYDTDTQCSRINAIRQTSTDLFINARTDLFLKAAEGSDRKALTKEAKIRAMAYADAGADGFFAPALKDPTLIADLVEASPIPVNIMMMDGVPPIRDLANLGVARISFGPGPYIQLMETLTANAKAVLPA